MREKAKSIVMPFQGKCPINPGDCLNYVHGVCDLCLTFLELVRHINSYTLRILAMYEPKTAKNEHLLDVLSNDFVMLCQK